MQIYTECVPCFVRQTLDAVRMTTDDERAHMEVLRTVLRAASEMDMTAPPPAMGQIIHRVIRQQTGVADPYRKIKDWSNEIGLRLAEQYRPELAQADDPLQMAARLAIAGNIIDFGKRQDLTEAEIDETVAAALTAPLDLDAFEEFRAAARQANDVLVLCDNAGEIALDLLLVEQIGPEKVTYVVRGAPVINDATREDAESVGMTELVEVIDNGSDAPGTILSTCSDAFVERFRAADLIVSKGQGNYETLSDEPAPIFFMLKIKCPVIAADAGQEVGQLVVERSRSWPAG